MYATFVVTLILRHIIDPIKHKLVLYNIMSFLLYNDGICTDPMGTYKKILAGKIKFPGFFSRR